ncbi:excisionase family DNA-binding protein [Zhouia sp. PK063]|uniref:excisionase family DNA-binding protein n=1 Tax=Zhouia sp. PK063 TaxID=3373602 RepID=UPI0037881A20
MIKLEKIMPLINELSDNDKIQLRDFLDNNLIEENKDYEKISLTRKKMLALNLEAMQIFDANNTCMTVEECASFLNVHKATVQRKIATGEFKSTFIGKMHRIPKIQFLKEIIN